MKCPYCKQDVPDDVWHKCDGARASHIKLSRQCGKTKATTDWMETFVENAKLHKRIEQLEAAFKRACSELEAQIEELKEQVHGSDEQKAEAEGVIAMLKDGIKRLPEFIRDNALSAGDLTPGVLDEYFSLCLMIPDSHMKL